MQSPVSFQNLLAGSSTLLEEGGPGRLLQGKQAILWHCKLRTSFSPPQLLSEFVGRGSSSPLAEPLSWTTCWDFFPSEKICLQRLNYLSALCQENETGKLTSLASIFLEQNPSQTKFPAAGQRNCCNAGITEAASLLFCHLPGTSHVGCTLLWLKGEDTWSGTNGGGCRNAL